MARGRCARGVRGGEGGDMCGTVAMATEPQLMSDNVADRRSVGVDCLCVCECVLVCWG